MTHILKFSFCEQTCEEKKLSVCGGISFQSCLMIKACSFCFFQRLLSKMKLHFDAKPEWSNDIQSEVLHVGSVCALAISLNLHVNVCVCVIPSICNHVFVHQ